MGSENKHDVPEINFLELGNERTAVKREIVL